MSVWEENTCMVTTLTFCGVVWLFDVGPKINVSYQNEPIAKNITMQSVASLHTPHLSMIPIVTFTFELWPPKSIGFTMVNMSIKSDKEAHNGLVCVGFTVFYTPDLSGRINTIMVWRGRLSVCLSVHKACKHDTDWTVPARTFKLGTLTTYDKRTNPIDFQGQGSMVKEARNTLLLNLVNKVKPFYIANYDVISLLNSLVGPILQRWHCSCFPYVSTVTLTFDLQNQ